MCTQAFGKADMHGRCAGDAFAAKAAAYLDVIDSPNSEPDPTPDAAEPDDLHNPGDRWSPFEFEIGNHPTESV
jgi:hypothetical protein